MLFALDSLLFRTNIYPPVINPDSAAGNVENLLWNEMHRTVRDRNQVLAVGNSRMSLRPRVANMLDPSTGYTFASIVLGGTTPRTWYYQLRDVDPAARRYAAILIPVEDYDDLDVFGDRADWPLDPNFLACRLRLTDLFEFSGSYHRLDYRWMAFRDILFKGPVYKSDFQDFLKSPKKRIKQVRFNREHSAGWIYKFVGGAQNLKGLEVDWSTRTARYPAGFNEVQRATIKNVLLAPRPRHTGRQEAYLHYWFGRIRDRYRGSGTKLIFLRVARGPLVDPAPVRRNPHSSVRDLASQPDVIALDEHLFDSLERPELFVDAMHLNAEGCIRFTEILAREVRRVLGPAQAASSHAL